MLSLRAVPVVGDSSPSRWGEVLTTPDGCAVVEVSGLGAREKGVKYLGHIRDHFTRTHDSPVLFVSLPEAPEEVEIETAILLQLSGEEVTIVLQGEGSVYLKRGASVSRLMYRTGVMSGTVGAGDQLFLGSKGCVKTFSEQEVYRLFDHLTPEEVAEKAAIALYAKGQAGAAGMVIGLGASPQDPLAATQAKEAHTQRRLYALEPKAIGVWVQKKWKLLIALVLIAGFLISIILGVARQITASKNKATDEAIASAERLADEGVSLLELNAVKSRDRLKEAKDIIAPLTSTVNPRTAEGKKVADLSQQINDNLTLALHSVLGVPTLFYDVSLLKSGAAITSLGVFGDSMAITDSKTRTLFLLSLSSKQGAIVGGGEGFTGATYTDIAGTGIYTLTDKGIQKTSTSDKSTSAVVVPSDSEWGQIAALTVFGGNIYLLDSGKSRIWKYVATDVGATGFTDRQQYLNPDAFPDLSTGTGLAIDGSVWAGTKSGDILRFVQGQEQTFIPRGIDPPLGTYLFVYASDEDVHLYVLDREHSRVVVLDKDGMYLGQYTWDNGLAPTQIAVSETLKKIFLLVGGKLYYIDLK